MTATTFSIEIDLPGVEIKRVQLTREGAYEIRVSSTLTRNRGQNTDSAKILEHIIYSLFFLYTGTPWLTRTYLSVAHTLDFVFEVLSAQHPFLFQGFTHCMDLPMISSVVDHK
jgi:hypothetical protein